MKKNSIYALMSAIALSGAIGFSSCSSTENDVAEVNPGYDPATGDVPVQFVFNVSMGNTPTTRQTAEATQANQNESDQTNPQKFRGIDHCLILSEAQDDDGKYISSPVEMDKMYDLSRVLDANAISSADSRRVLEMAFPAGTNSIMFYGKAIVGSISDAESEAGLTVNDVFGHLKSTGGYQVGEELNNVCFEVQKRLNPDYEDKYDEIQTLLAGILTCIMNTNLAGSNHDGITATGTPGTGIPPYGDDIAATAYNDFSWADYANNTGEDGKRKSPALPKIESGFPKTNNLTPLEEKLANAYTPMVDINAAGGELRCGAGDAVEKMIQDLWTIVNSVRCATPTGKQEAIAKYLATKIHLNISQYFTGTVPSDGGPVTDVHFLTTVNLMKSRFISSTDNPYWPTGAGDSPSSFDHIDSDEKFGEFPYYFHLPAGATHLATAPISETDYTQIFSYVKNFNTSGMTGAVTSDFTVNSYYFPPELLYFGNSPIRVCDKEHVVSDYPQTVATWHTDASWPTVDNKAWIANSHVLSSTRSVAMMNDINYGTALLKTTVGYQLEGAPQLDGVPGLYDNNGGIHDGEVPNVIPVSNSAFQLVGILVGGQSKVVGWDFLPKSNAGTYTYGYVYDCDIADTQIPATGSSKPNYTLVFDNYHAPASVGAAEVDQDKVYISLELKNNSGYDFFGKNGMIKNGDKFYLIGLLDPAKEGLTLPSWPTYHPLPPYYQTGETLVGEKQIGDSKEIARVFMQDYMTTVNFKIGVNSLKYAYLTVPDLRSSSLTLGLSVDLSWSTGLNFGDVIVGGE